MKTLKRFFIVSFAMLFLGIVSQVGVHAASNDYYYSCDGIANAYEIDLSNEKLYACRDKITNPVNVENLVSYTNSITKSYQVHIYHYYVPYDGYYTAYTTGSKDTKIRLYRENQILWWINGFIGFDRTEDDGSKCDNNYYNACSIEWLVKGYYYVAVRMYGKATGSYTINIGPNEDLIYRPRYSNYNTWTRNDNYRAKQTTSYYVVTKKKEYYSWQESLILYWLLTDNSQITINIGEYAKEYGKSSMTAKELIDLYRFREKQSLAINIAGTMFGVICSFAHASRPVSFSATAISSLLSCAVNIPKKSEAAKAIAVECGIIFELGSMLDDHAEANVFIERNLIVYSVYDNMGSTVEEFFRYEFSSWDENDDYFRGLYCARGDWSNA